MIQCNLGRTGIRRMRLSQRVRMNVRGTVRMLLCQKSSRCTCTGCCLARILNFAGTFRNPRTGLPPGQTYRLHSQDKALLSKQMETSSTFHVGTANSFSLMLPRQSTNMFLRHILCTNYYPWLACTFQGHMMYNLDKVLQTQPCSDMLRRQTQSHQRLRRVCRSHLAVPSHSGRLPAHIRHTSRFPAC